MTTPGVRNNFLPPGFVSNLQDVLKKKGNNEDDDDKSNDKKDDESAATVQSSSSSPDDYDPSKPVIFVTNTDGIDSPGLTCLVEALVAQGLYNVSVCAPQVDKSLTGHSFSYQESIAVSTAEIKGATAYEVSGTPVDCVSLALSGALFYSSAVAGAREALFSGVASLSLSLSWKKGESQESHFKDAVSVCLPVIKAAIRDLEKGSFPKSSSLHITVPTSPSENKGFKLTKQSLWRSKPIWQAIAANRNPAASRFMANQPGMGLQLAQLGRDASAAKKSLEVVESVGVAGKADLNRIVKYFRLELQDTNQEDTDENLDFRALQNGFVSVTPISVSSVIEPDIETAASKWISDALQSDN
ncbi:hypothetical protein Ccrd_005019 [Cynara cardunculus var. scolymus]|uniref:Survival protein SurE-like phosphatase/nucleotidase domain-containing protein n=1 Tax=Cynara cardunculus var. scolymus TaxID=59895 RepID=A0A103XLL2_CYNCS|nr:hypothetical protein Ccrd_005019 [Cynara cardunculus var. scolymus]